MANNNVSIEQGTRNYLRFADGSPRRALVSAQKKLRIEQQFGINDGWTEKVIKRLSKMIRH